MTELSEKIVVNKGTENRVVFTPSGLTQQVESGMTLLQTAQEAGVAIRSLCGGNGKCRQCWIEVAEGFHSKHGVECSIDHVTPPSELEQRVFKSNPKYQGMRLACRTQVVGDLVIDVPEVSQEHVAYISKKNDYREFTLDPVIRLIDCELDEATMDDNPSATENLLAQLVKVSVTATLNYNLLSGLQKTIEDTKGKLTVALRDEKEVIAIYPQGNHQIVGGAVDIGSTTLALYVYDLHTAELLYEASAMNPQIRFGEDLMSRVSYVMMNKGGDKKLTDTVREKISDMVHSACKALDVEHDKLLEMVLVGNPIMHHLFFGLSPVALGQAPFTVATRDWLEVNAVDLSLDFFANTRIAFLPLIAGHVGADTAAAYLSEIDSMQANTTLLVDIGTNAEIMLAKDGVVYATSSPTGPAFEGAEISAGVRASHGAIERIRIDPDTLLVKYKVIGIDAWSDETEFIQAKPRVIGICGSGIIEAMVCLAQAGLIDKGGLFVQSKAPERFDTRTDDTGSTIVRYLLVDQGENSLYIEQVDVRSIQLAKAALFAGVQLLMDYLDCDSFDQVLLAGAFGSHLDPHFVADLDIIPSASKDQIKSVGNAAGIGATKALLDRRERQKIIDEVRKVRKIESANEPKFQDYFVAGMKFSVSPVEGQQSNRNRRRRRK
ncbi:MAG: ASKHA domain-containing protein [Arenicella sp.]